MVLLLVFMQLTRDLFAIAKFLYTTPVAIGIEHVNDYTLVRFEIRFERNFPICRSLFKRVYKLYTKRYTQRYI